MRLHPEYEKIKLYKMILKCSTEASGQGLLLLGLAALLTFGDEILLRLVDRLSIGGRANEASGSKADIDLAAYQKYLTVYRKRALAQAEEAGERSKVDFDWLEVETDE